MPNHLSEAALTFLRDLKRNNNRAWFSENKSVYERELREPVLALIDQVNEGLLSFAPEHVRPPQKCMLRIYRDIRFSKDKRPYKTHVSAWWARDDMAKTSGAGFYFDVSGTEVTVAAGVFMPERDQLLAIRRFLASSHEDLQSLLTKKKLRGLMEPAAGLPLTRPPKGFVSETDAALEWIRCRQWGVTATLPAESAVLPTLGTEILKRFRLAAPIVALLNKPLHSKPRRPLF
jgi:uncharacterized protein (TIGR02453 family)